MKHLLLIFCSIVALNCTAHDYFFAFAELQYNDFTKKFESTVSASSHDLERILANKGIEVDSLDLLAPGSQKLQKMENYLNQGFRISTTSTRAHLTIVGIEVLLDGMVHFYLESDEIEINESVQIEFSFLMKELPEQQNKLTLYVRDKSYTTTFLQGNSTHQILIEQ